MKVKATALRTTAGTYYVLKNTGNNSILHNAPNKWKTKRGAENWASNNGYLIQAPPKRKKQQAKRAPSACKPAAKSSKTRKAGEKSCRK